MEPVTAAVAVAAVVGVCLWLLFRRGSMADRARAGAEAMDAGSSATDPTEDPTTPT
jgi:hypothetical protein